MPTEEKIEYLSLDKTSDTTVTTVALMLTCLIDKIECRRVATVNIPGSFMKADMGGKTVKINYKERW